jgi:hypothetical protein
LPNFSGVIDTAEIDMRIRSKVSGVSMKPKNDFESPYLILKRTSSKTISYDVITLSKKSYGILNFIFGFSSVIDTAETDFGDFRSDYLGEYEAICETVLAC